jgi:hypothetical protein
MSKRRITLAGVVAVCVLVFSGLVDIGTAGASKPVITASGDITCTGSGILKGFTYGNPPGFTATIHIKGRINLACTGSTGTPGVTISSAKLQGFLTYTGDCTPDYRWNFGIVWRSKQAKINPTAMNFFNAQGTPSGWSLPGQGGTSEVTGSWAGTDTASGTISGSSQMIESHCLAGQDPDHKFRKFKYATTVTVSL